MSDTREHPSSSSETPPSETPPESLQTKAAGESRLVRFGRKHPALTVAGIAGVGLVGGIEMAAGVLLGAGVAALLRRSNGAVTRTPAEETRGHMRGILDRTPHDLNELKQRARAVIHAALGEEPAPRQAEAPTQSSAPRDVTA